MSTAFKCDRCKELFSGERCASASLTVFRTPKRNYNIKPSHTRSSDDDDSPVKELCESCTVDVFEVLNTAPTKAGP